MKRVFLLAPYFPPRRRVGSYRAFKFAIHLKSFGWEPIVIHLSVNNSSLSIREQSFLQGIKRVELPLPFDRSTKSSGSYTSSDKPKNPNSVVSYLGDLFDHSFPIDTWWPVFRLHQNKLKKLAYELQPDMIWSTSDPWSINVVAMNLAQKNNIPWVADFRDPWTLCPVRSPARMPWARAFDKKMERKIISQASHIIFTAKSTAAKYREHYTEVNTPISTIYNSFDEEYFLPVNKENISNNKQKKFTLMFYGRFRTLSPATPVIALLKRLKNTNPVVFSVISVQSYGDLNTEDMKAAKSAGVYEVFETIGPEPYENTLNNLEKADLLLLSTELKRDDIIPAKLWDYLIVNKPILSLSKNPEIAEILDETGTGKQFAPHELDKAANMLIECFKSREAGKTMDLSGEHRKSKIQAYSSVNTTAQLAKIFDQLSNA
ncbi:MAG: glycosyltransferase [Balneolales bacterium]